MNNDFDAIILVALIIGSYFVSHDFESFMILHFDYFDMQILISYEEFM